MLLDLQRFVARDAPSAHEHLEEDVTKRQGLGFRAEGCEGVVGYAVADSGLRFAEFSEEGTVGLRG